MAMHVPKPPGFAQMLKDGAKVSKLKEKKVLILDFGVDEAIQ